MKTTKELWDHIMRCNFVESTHQDQARHTAYMETLNEIRKLLLHTIDSDFGDWERKGIEAALQFALSESTQKDK